MGHITCQPYVITWTTKEDGVVQHGYRAVCTRHDWHSQTWGTRAEAIRSKGAHKRAKKTRKRA
jgi:hypothetical protein